MSQVNNRKKNQSYEGPERQHQLSLRLGDDVLRLLLTINTHTHTPCGLTEEGGCRLLTTIHSVRKVHNGVLKVKSVMSLKTSDSVNSKTFVSVIHLNMLASVLALFHSS